MNLVLVPLFHAVLLQKNSSEFREVWRGGDMATCFKPSAYLELKY